MLCGAASSDCPFGRRLEILRCEPSATRYTRQHLWANLRAVVKRKDNVRPAFTRENLV